MRTLHVLLRPETRNLIEVQMWDDVLSVTPSNKEADGWFSEFLETSCRLVYMPDEVVRPAGPEYAEEGDQVSFADRFPFLLISEASLEELNK